MKMWTKAVFAFLAIVFIYHTWFEKASWFDFSPNIKDHHLTEISGLVFSVRNENSIWVHNDHKRFKLYLIDKHGNTKAVFRSKLQVKDWEEIAMGPGKIKDKPYLYVGDIGDNYARRPFVMIYRFPEPLSTDDTNIENMESFKLKYPDGSRDAEAMFVDPLSKQLYIISKREEEAGIYTTALTAPAGDTVMLKKVGALDLRGVGLLRWVTAADISRDGSQILVRSYGYVYYWKRKPGQTVEQAMREEPDILPHKSEIQGEAIGFTPDGKGFYTLSEGKHVSLNHSKIPSE